MAKIKDQLAEELAEVTWGDLIPHSKRDAIIVVHPPLTVLDVGLALANDDTQAVQHWISEQLIHKPTVDDLSAWNQEPTKQFSALIVQPFVVVAMV